MLSGEFFEFPNSLSARNLNIQAVKAFESGMILIVPKPASIVKRNRLCEVPKIYGRGQDHTLADQGRPG